MSKVSQRTLLSFILLNKRWKQHKYSHNSLKQWTSYHWLVVDSIVFCFGTCLSLTKFSQHLDFNNIFQRIFICFWAVLKAVFFTVCKSFCMDKGVILFVMVLWNLKGYLVLSYVSEDIAEEWWRTNTGQKENFVLDLATGGVVHWSL